MIEKLDPPNDHSTDALHDQSFQPVMTQEVLAGTEARQREEILSPPDVPTAEGAGAAGGSGAATSSAQEASRGDGLPAVLAVEQATRTARRQMGLLILALGLIAIFQVITFLGIRNRDPVRVYQAGPADFLVQP